MSILILIENYFDIFIFWQPIVWIFMTFKVLVIIFLVGDEAVPLDVEFLLLKFRFFCFICRGQNLIQVILPHIKLSFVGYDSRIFIGIR